MNNLFSQSFNSQKHSLFSQSVNSQKHRVYLVNQLIPKNTENLFNNQFAKAQDLFSQKLIHKNTESI